MINVLSNKMSHPQGRSERYLLKFRFNTTVDHKAKSGPGTKSPAGRHGVQVRVTNRLPSPLTSDQLQAVSLSIPGLYVRSQQYPPGTSRGGMFHCGQLQIYRLPLAAAPPPEGPRGEQPPSTAPPPEGPRGEQLPLTTASPEGQRRELELMDGGECEEQKHVLANEIDAQSQASDAEFFSCSASDAVSDVTSGSGDSFNTACADLAPSDELCDLATSDNVRDLSASDCYSARVRVEFKGDQYLRLQTPAVAAGGEEEDVECSWVVTDVMEDDGQLVSSMRLDFLKPKPEVPRWMRHLEAEPDAEGEAELEAEDHSGTAGH